MGCAISVVAQNTESIAFFVGFDIGKTIMAKRAETYMVSGEFEPLALEPAVKFH